MTINDPGTRAYVWRRGVDPDDIDELLAADAVASPDGFAEVLGAIEPASIDRRHHERLRELCLHQSVEVQCKALELLAGAMGPDVLPLCSELLANPRFRHKASAIEGLTQFGSRSEIETVLRATKSHLTGRTKAWWGSTPVIRAAQFLERVDRDGIPRKEFARWIGRRWHLLSSDERAQLQSHEPPRVNDPPTLLVVAGAPDEARRVRELGARVLRRFGWTDQPSGQSRGPLITALRAADATICLDAQSTRTCLRLQGPDMVRPVIRCRTDGLSEDACSERKLACRLVESMEYLFE